MRIEAFKRGVRSKSQETADSRSGLVFMANYYETRFKVTHDVLYEYCIQVVLKAIEKLDGGGIPVATCEMPACKMGAHDTPAVQPSPSQVLLQMLDSTPRPIDGLIFASGFEASVVLAELLKLELCGKAKRHAGNRYTRGIK